MTRAEMLQLMATPEGRFYVYRLHRPDGRPFYVGKGTVVGASGRERLFAHEQEARQDHLRSHKTNVIRQINFQVDYQIDAWFDTESAAFAHERALIRSIGRYPHGPLTNLTEGGEGTADPSPEVKARIDMTLGGADATGARGIANRLVRRFYDQWSAGAPVPSVPIKPLSEFHPRPAKRYTEARRPTLRMCTALLVAAIGGGVLLEPGAIIPRAFTLEGHDFAIENGCLGEMLSAGLVRVVSGGTPGAERLELTEHGFQAMLATDTGFGRTALVGEGVLLSTE